MSIMRRWTRGRSNGDGRGEQETGEMVRPMMSLQRRINQMFDDFFEEPLMRQGAPMMERGFGAMEPRMDFSETEEAYKLTADVPGMTEEDIEITVSDSNLAISGERSEESEQDDEDYVRRERSYGMFRRRIPLPQNIEHDNITATFNNGVLNIELPKSEEAKSNWKKIDIQSEQ